MTADRPVADRAEPHAFTDRRGRNLCDRCDRYIGAAVHADRPVADREPLNAEDALARELHSFVHVGPWAAETETGWHETHRDHAQSMIAGLRQFGFTLATLDAARSHPDEAGLRAEIADLLPDLDTNYDARYRQGYERARTLVRDATARAALAQPAVPVAGADDPLACGICGDYTVKGIEVHEICLAALRAAQPEDDGLDVERLALAIPEGWEHRPAKYWRQLAERIAARYEGKAVVDE